MSLWHRRGTLPVDRAREVARTCWEALRRVDPEAADLIARAAVEAGEEWLTPEVAQYGLDDDVTVQVAARLAGRSVSWAYAWAREHRDQCVIVGLDGLMRVRVRDILESVAQERRADVTGGESPGGP